MLINLLFYYIFPSFIDRQLNLWRMVNRYLTRIKSCDTVNSIVNEQIELNTQLGNDSQDHSNSSYSFRAKKLMVCYKQAQKHNLRF